MINKPNIQRNGKGVGKAGRVTGAAHNRGVGLFDGWVGYGLVILCPEVI
jgi:hypothetical protein